MIRSAPRSPGSYRDVALALLAFASGCGSDGNPAGPELEQVLGACSIPTSQIFIGQVRDGIPALTNPGVVRPGDPGTEYLIPGDRVIGLVVDGDAYAVPLNILWRHEIANLDFAGLQLAVTHCPLTGSSLVFDRAAVGGAEFGVSGLLYQNNLVMYDRTGTASHWPQMARGARCGPQDGLQLDMYPAVEMTWEGWRTLHPQSWVVSSNTGFGGNYVVYPYGDYDRIDNRALLFPQPAIDTRRPPKERVLGIPDATRGIAYPFLELAEHGDVAAVEGDGHVVFWDEARQAAMAWEPELDGALLRFEVVDGRIQDAGTGSVWTVAGEAVQGPLAGARLRAVAEAYVAFWFAWAAFHPQTAVWSGS